MTYYFFRGTGRGHSPAAARGCRANYPGRTAVPAVVGHGYRGLVALATILAAHWVISTGRSAVPVAKLTDHRVRVLVEHGRVRDRQLRVCGITRNDLFAQLRQQGVYRLADLRYVLYETNGGLTVVPEDAGDSREQDWRPRGCATRRDMPPPGTGSPSMRTR